ncbi:hypothetical protein BDB01DRAFT_840355 [Pilobolus umbonatus]|nr:hypothetical protein BDB01DRAFT_840355 [Pilobolus umbonatus]
MQQLYYSQLQIGLGDVNVEVECTVIRRSMRWDELEFQLLHRRGDKQLKVSDGDVEVECTVIRVDVVQHTVYATAYDYIGSIYCNMVSVMGFRSGMKSHHNGSS